VQALNITVTDNDDYGNILISTPGIIFLATPHGGSDAASVASMLASIMNLPLFGVGLPRARKDSLQALEKGSKQLFEIARDFRKHTRDITMYSFIEKMSIPPFRNRVSPGVEENTSVFC